MKVMGLMFVSLFSTVAMAQTAVKPKPVIRFNEPVQVKPAPIMNRAVKPATEVQPSLDAFKSGVAAGKYQAANQNVAAETCSLSQFADKVTAGTHFSPADAEMVVKQGVITQGNCGGADGVAGYDVEARDNLMAAALHVSTALNGRKVGELNETQKAQLDTVWAKGLAQAKNRTAANDNQVTVASQITVARQLKEACAIRN